MLTAIGITLGVLNTLGATNLKLNVPFFDVLNDELGYGFANPGILIRTRIATP